MRRTLTAEQVTEARSFAPIKTRSTLRRLARAWDVHPQALRQAINGHSWQWLPTPEPATSLPDWLQGPDDPTPHCSHCKLWDKNKCSITLPEAGGFFASACACYHPPTKRL